MTCAVPKAQGHPLAFVLCSSYLTVTVISPLDRVAYTFHLLVASKENCSKDVENTFLSRTDKKKIKRIKYVTKGQNIRLHTTYETQGL
jgi:hypothetical protein